MVKHMTASALVWTHTPDGWQLGLIEHPIRHLLLPPGGHVEPDENTCEAVLREVAEETGLEVNLLQPPGPAVPSSFPVPVVDRPWWICEHQIPYDNQLAAPHIHVDHVYVAVARNPEPVTPPAHPFAWHPVAAWPQLDMPDDTRQLADLILPVLTDYAEPF